MTSAAQPAKWKTILAFGAIYVLWGSMFLAIRIGVREMPPFVLAAMRFTVAGLILYVWTLARGEHAPAARHWLSALVLAVLIFVLDYGLLFWAEQRVPSGVASVMMATIPAFMALSEIVLLRTQRLNLRLGAALLTGLAGVAVLMSHSLRLGGAPIHRAGGVALIIAAMSWSVASALIRKLPLPASRVMTAGMQMLVGGILLAGTAAATGEFGRFRPAEVTRAGWLALAYLTVAGSLVGFTAFVWLIHHQSPTRVGTYAYVNPVIAVLLGYFFAGESLGLRTVLGAACVLMSVVVITMTGALKAAATIPAEEPVLVGEPEP